jgi:hypothetical protein
MRLPSIEVSTLWASLSADEFLFRRMLSDADTEIRLDELKETSSLGGGPEQPRGQSVLLATRNQLTSALALIELDGIARRLVLCPPGVRDAQLPFIIDAAGADAIVTDGSAFKRIQAKARFVQCSPRLQPMREDRRGGLQTATGSY